MSGRSFLDANVLVYTDASDAPAKQRVALDLCARHFADRTGVVSPQVLQEYFVAATRKLGVDAAVARRKVELFGRLDVAVVGVPAILAAIDLHRLNRLSFWDALVIQAARQTGCDVLFTEALQAGAVIDGVRIVNPFAA
jgi:predicted nucleic acid-binding protein